MPFRTAHAPLPLIQPMFKRLFFFLLLASSAFAQTPNQPVVRFANEDSIRSIIVKFRSVQAMSDSSVLAQLRRISTSSDIMRPMFQRPIAQTNSIQSISIDTIGLNRIVQVYLREGITAQDAVHALSGMSAFEYVEPNYRYHILT